MDAPLAYNNDGDSFEPPATAVSWRVKRIRPRGAPELVYGVDGTPLLVPLSITGDKLEDIVREPGRYRLDPVDKQKRVVEGACPGYVWVHAADSETAPLAQSSNGPLDTNAVLIAAMKANTELARSIVDQFPAMLEASATLIRAADGAGLPRRLPPDLDYEEEPEERVREAPPRAGFDLNRVLAELIPTLLSSLGGKLPKLDEMLDWRLAAKRANAAPTRKDDPTSTLAKQELTASTTMEADAIEPLSPRALAHFAAVRAALTPEEGALAQAAASELTAGELRALVDVLATLEVDEAVAYIRDKITRSATQNPK